MACDICGKVGTELYTLLSAYQTEDIKYICRECNKVIDKTNGKLLTSVMKIKQVWLKSWIKNLKEAINE